MKRRGRPSKPSLLKPETTKRMPFCIAAGMSATATCEICGVPLRTYYEWMKRGEAEQSGPYYEFYRAIARARGQAKKKYMAKILAAGKRDWRALAWWYEKLYGSEFEVEPSEQADDKGPTLQIYYNNDQPLPQLLNFPVHNSMFEPAKEKLSDIAPAYEPPPAAEEISDAPEEPVAPPPACLTGRLQRWQRRNGKNNERINSNKRRCR